jgi:hypothetical protein
VRVSYRAVRPYRFGEEVCYEVVGAVVFCCRQMRRRWGSLIVFGAPGHARTTSRDVNLAVVVPQANGDSTLSLIPIHHCAFCGEAVETCRVK